MIDILGETNISNCNTNQYTNWRKLRIYVFTEGGGMDASFNTENLQPSAGLSCGPTRANRKRRRSLRAEMDWLLIADKNKSENIKTYADRLQCRPMFEENRWDKYKVVDTAEFPDGYKSLTTQLVVESGKNISYQVHRHCNEVWTFIDGEGGCSTVSDLLSAEAIQL